MFRVAPPHRKRSVAFFSIRYFFSGARNGTATGDTRLEQQQKKVRKKGQKKGGKKGEKE